MKRAEYLFYQLHDNPSHVHQEITLPRLLAEVRKFLAKQNKLGCEYLK